MDKSELKITAGLASIDLSDDEFDSLGKGVEKMLEYFSKMAEVDVSALSPTTHLLLKETRTRSDKAAPNENADALLENAPDREDRVSVIPNVL